VTPAPVSGFDYVENAEVARTPAQWRDSFPPARFDRRTGLAHGETWYFLKSGKLAAEAYAIIPPGGVA
jgi:hypothetical protein